MRGHCLKNKTFKSVAEISCILNHSLLKLMCGNPHVTLFGGREFGVPEVIELKWFRRMELNTPWWYSYEKSNLDTSIHKEAIWNYWENRTHKIRKVICSKYGLAGSRQDSKHTAFRMERQWISVAYISRLRWYLWQLEKPMVHPHGSQLSYNMVNTNTGPDHSDLIPRLKRHCFISKEKKGLVHPLSPFSVKPLYAALSDNYWLRMTFCFVMLWNPHGREFFSTVSAANPSKTQSLEGKKWTSDFSSSSPWWCRNGNMSSAVHPVADC